MFNKIRGIPHRNVFIVLALAIFALSMIAWVGSSKEDRLVGKLFATTIQPMFGTEVKNLTIGSTTTTKRIFKEGRWSDRSDPVIVSLAGTSYYTINPALGSEFWIDDYLSQDGTRDAGSGVSIRLFKITEAYDGYAVTIRKMTGLSTIGTTAGSTPFGTGTTDICITTVPWSSGTTDGMWNVTTGVTQESSTKVLPEIVEMDAVGDYLTFKAKYGQSGSTWYQIGRYIQ